MGVCFFLWYKVTGTRADRYKRSDMGSLKSMGLPGVGKLYLYRGYNSTYNIL